MTKIWTVEKADLMIQHEIDELSQLLAITTDPADYARIETQINEYKNAYSSEEEVNE